MSFDYWTMLNFDCLTYFWVQTCFSKLACPAVHFDNLLELIKFRFSKLTLPWSTERSNGKYFCWYHLWWDLDWNFVVAQNGRVFSNCCKNFNPIITNHGPLLSFENICGRIGFSLTADYFVTILVFIYPHCPWYSYITQYTFVVDGRWA